MQGSPELYAMRVMFAAALERRGERLWSVKVTLTRKLAGVLNGIDLTARREGDVMEMLDEDARLLIAEGWAVPHMKESPTADDRPRRPHSKKRQ